ncbi:MAG: hypothetical protein RL261_1020, partial [Pseudomonadota bacterium]
MDNPRLFLWIGLALLAWMNIIAWDRDYGAHSTVAPTTAAAPGAAPATPAPAAGNAQSSLPSLPSAAPPVVGTTAAATVQTPAIGAVATSAPTIRVVTDVLDMDISLQGGDLLRADLLKYPQDKKPG